MSGRSKAKHRLENLRGKAKAGLGKATRDRDIEARGRADQAKADLQDAGEKVKDALDR